MRKQNDIISDWAKLLANQPQFEYLDPDWNKFGCAEWAYVLSKQPQFADKCTKRDKFNIPEGVRVCKNCVYFDDIVDGLFIGYCPISQVTYTTGELGNVCDEYKVCPVTHKEF